MPTKSTTSHPENQPTSAHTGATRARRKGRISRVSGAVVAAGLVAAAVGCSNGDSTVDSTVPSTSAPTSTSSTTTSLVPDLPMFGDMPSPCGPAGAAGIPAVADGQNGSSPLKLGTATDSGFPLADRPSADMLDAARAFASWCNAQGGIRGLPIDIVELDAAIDNVPLSMEFACAEVFAMVGGAWTFDDRMFPRFHECGMISIPARSATAAAAMANGKVQPIPTPADREAATWLKWIAKTYADAVDEVAIVHADLGSTRLEAVRLEAAMRATGDFGDPVMIEHEFSGSPDWSDAVDEIRTSSISAVGFVGEAEHLAGFVAALDSAAVDVEIVFGDSRLANELVRSASAAAPPGSSNFGDVRIRSVHPPLDETETNPAIASYFDMMSALDPAGRLGSLGLHTVSAMLLFATAANTCLDADANVLERECLLAEAQKISSWTAGGLHAATEPGANAPTPCIAILGLESGRWTRSFPVPGSSDDDGGGYTCDDDVLALEGDFGDTSIGFDPSRSN